MKEDMTRTAGPLVEARSTGIEVHVEQHVKDKMQGWCNAAHSEVSGWFQVKKIDNIFYVYNVYLPAQFGSSGYTKIINGTSSLINYFKSVVGGDFSVEGAFEAYDELCKDLKGWWHTHYNGNVFWSGTDDNQAQEAAELAEDWSLSIVINQAGHWLARIDVVSPVPVMINKLPITFVPNKKRHAKRNYQWDVNRWVKPFPPEPKKRAIWSTDRVIVSDEPEEAKYVNVGGTVMPMSVFKEIIECPCGDMTCVDCSDAIKQYNKGVIYDA